MYFDYCAKCGEKSNEVNDIRWYKIEEVDAVIARENNCSGMHFDKCRPYLEVEK